MEQARRMRTLALALAVTLVSSSPVGAAPLSTGRALVLADFEEEPPACFPPGWKTRSDQASAERVYRTTEENGERFLRAVANGESVQIGTPVSFDVTDHPWLTWRWRATELPAGADERDAATNDSAAGVYVVFKGGFAGLLPRAIKYVWSTRAPRGTALPSPRYPNARIVVLESGADPTPRWHVETVNVLEDYRRLFHAEPSEAQGIALLTDADNTGSRAAADYGDIRALATRGDAPDTPDVALHAR
jgi:hypothetical protein